MLRKLSLALALAFLFAQLTRAEITVLIVDGQNNHNWKATTPVLKKALEENEMFKVDVATSPPSGGDMSTFHPKFDEYDVVMSNYNGQRWSTKTEQALIDYVHGGGGFVVVHAANNSFSDWPEYNEMIGLGGWGGRGSSLPHAHATGHRRRDPRPGRYARVGTPVGGRRRGSPCRFAG